MSAKEKDKTEEISEVQELRQVLNESVNKVFEASSEDY